MIRKSGYRFSEKMCSNQELNHDPIRFDRIMVKTPRSA